MNTAKLNPDELYCALMQEASSRIEVLNFILSGRTRLAEGIVRELCWLQIRMLCETIAIGCLVAHGDLVSTHIKRFEKEYAADKIIKLMERLNPHFFPQQVVFGVNHTGPTITANTKENALKMSELSKLYRRCGEVLHRGRFETVFFSDQVSRGPLEVAEIVSSAQKIDDLLCSHIIPLKVTTTSSKMLICVLRDSNRNFLTTVNRLEMSRLHHN